MDFQQMLSQKQATKVMVFIPQFPDQFFEMELNKNVLGNSVLISNLDDIYPTIFGHKKCFLLRSQKDVDDFFYVTLKKDFTQDDYAKGQEHFKKNAKKWIY